MTLGDSSDAIQCGRGQCPPTLWDQISLAGKSSSPEQEEALARFCEAYRYPLYAFARRSGQSLEEAEDLTQGFFLHLLEDRVLSKVKRNGGRFRSFLLTSFTNYCRNVWAGKAAGKRGGGQRLISLDDTAEVRYAQEPTDHLTPETLYDLGWALLVQEQAFARLLEEYRKAGNERLFSCVQGFLPGATEAISYAQASEKLGMTDEALRMAVSRLRRKFGQLLREEIAVPGTPREEIDEELRYLMALLSTR
jgi:RNA polymerase sigma-70 factor (ECF subfamily)